MKKRLIAAAAILIVVVALAGPAWAGSAREAMQDGLAALAAGELDRAVARLSEAIDSGRLGRDELAKAYNARGQAYERKGFWGSAENDYAEALWLRPEREAYRWDLEYIRRQTGGGPM